MKHDFLLSYQTFLKEEEAHKKKDRADATEDIS